VKLRIADTANAVWRLMAHERREKGVSQFRLFGVFRGQYGRQDARRYGKQRLADRQLGARADSVCWSILANPDSEVGHL
jgi:hypothetical protein